VYSEYLIVTNIKSEKAVIARSEGSPVFLKLVRMSKDFKPANQLNIPEEQYPQSRYCY
jgi:hypothetical protein